MALPRCLSATEKALLYELLSRSNPPEVAALLSQIDAAQVVEECSCPCPTIALHVDPRHATPVDYSAAPVASADFEGGGVMAVVKSGWVTLLELYWWTDEPPTDWPQPAELTHHRAG